MTGSYGKTYIQYMERHGCQMTHINCKCPGQKEKRKIGKGIGHTKNLNKTVHNFYHIS
jgi:hypothetical protein